MPRPNTVNEKRHRASAPGHTGLDNPSQTDIGTHTVFSEGLFPCSLLALWLEVSSVSLQVSSSCLVCQSVLTHAKAVMYYGGHLQIAWFSTKDVQIPAQGFTHRSLIALSR